VNLSEPPLGNNNHRKEAEVVEALLESKLEIVEERSTNANSITKVFTYIEIKPVKIRETTTHNTKSVAKNK
jgi:hypothetical protein